LHGQTILSTKIAYTRDIWREMSMQKENWLIANEPMGNKKRRTDIFLGHRLLD
jgi:hypothetical protein